MTSTSACQSAVQAPALFSRLSLFQVLSLHGLEFATSYVCVTVDGIPFLHPFPFGCFKQSFKVLFVYIYK